MSYQKQLMILLLTISWINCCSSSPMLFAKSFMEHFDTFLFPSLDLWIHKNSNEINCLCIIQVSRLKPTHKAVIFWNTDDDNNYADSHIDDVVILANPFASNSYEDSIVSEGGDVNKIISDTANEKGDYSWLSFQNRIMLQPSNYIHGLWKKTISCHSWFQSSLGYSGKVSMHTKLMRIHPMLSKMTTIHPCLFWKLTYFSTQ